MSRAFVFLVLAAAVCAAAGSVLSPTAITGSASVYVGGEEIRIFRLDPKSGVLAVEDRVAVPASYMAADPSHRFVYAISGGAAPRVTAFSRDARTGRLTPINDTVVPDVEGGTHISVHPSGKWLLAAHFGSSHVSVLAVRSDGGVGGRVDLQSPGMRAHQIVSDPTGRYVLVPCRDGNLVAQYRIDPATGKLTPNDPAVVHASPGVGPRHMDFHPNGRFAYVINEQGGTITSYRYDKAKGTLSAPEEVSTLPPEHPKNSTAHVLVHPSGRFVYGSNRGHDSIAIFTVAKSTGRLSPLGHETGGGTIATPRDFGMDPAGRFLLVANQKAPGSVSVFAILSSARD